MISKCEVKVETSLKATYLVPTDQGFDALKLFYSHCLAV